MLYSLSKENVINPFSLPGVVMKCHCYWHVWPLQNWENVFENPILFMRSCIHINSVFSVDENILLFIHLKILLFLHRTVKTELFETFLAEVVKILSNRNFGLNSSY